MKTRSSGLKVRSGLRGGKLAANHTRSFLAATALVAGALEAGGCGPDRGGDEPATEVRAQSLLATTVTSTTVATGTGISVVVVPAPAAPRNLALQAAADSVTVGWLDGSTNEDGFVVSRRTIDGQWQVVQTVPSTSVGGTGARYTWIDRDRNISAQCYSVSAVASLQASGTPQQCVVRPDAGRFPQDPSPTVKEWAPYYYDDERTLFDVPRNACVGHEERTAGVSIGWDPNGTYDDVRIKPQGAGTHPLMQAEVVALWVPSGGWLKYATQAFGVNLDFSATPVYEWYLIAGSPGSTQFGPESALWNSTAKDYLVNGSEVWGIPLNWYQNTLPGGGGSPPRGVKTMVFYNCRVEGDTLEMWTLDLTVPGAPWTHQASLMAQPSDQCGWTAQPSWPFSPTPNHAFLVRAMDVLFPGCAGDDPVYGSCSASDTPNVIGDANGTIEPNPIN